MGLVDYVKKTYDSLSENEIRWQGRSVEIIDPLPDNIEIREVLKTVKLMVPDFLIGKIGSIKIGDHQKLRSRGVDAIFDKNDNLIVTNDQSDNYDLMNDIVHEIAHIAEDHYAPLIYSDKKIRQEFLNKRKALKRRLEQMDYDLTDYDFHKLKYNKDFDHFLWKEVGYNELAQIGHDLFLSPYAATSLREYWADAFEDYFLKNPKTVKQYCPAVFEKISNIF